ncbi:metal ABC transporter solute-binding protein, Zn/Mn family [Methanofollis ethanolicus]|uniref:metal ABC transporter solute-binding protein, Zn/Mn family n=1 Tax=Methanofollis ethanolicus TaxID=488124 RepID=UPI00082B46E8|nr:zinc ABC transporter substrate-binding protein [Methanofollis ethanolicus]
MMPAVPYRGLALCGVVFVFLSVFASGCTAGAPDSGKMLVAVTIPPQAESIEAIGGDRVDVLVLVPPGASPHTYELTPGQLADLSRARVYAVVGSGVEFETAWMGKIREVNPDMAVVNCSEGVTLVDGDPHIWLSPANAKIMAKNVCNGLITADPAGKKVYEANLAAYLARLDALDADIRAEIGASGCHALLVSHASWGYFARDYGLVQIAIEEGGKESSPRQIEEIVAHAQADNISVVFAAPEASTRSAHVVADEIDGRVVLLSPLAGNYTENLRAAAAAIAGSV